MVNCLYPVTSRSTVDFLDALAAASAFGTPPYVGTAINTLYGVPPIGSRRFLIRAIEFLAMENIGIEFDFWSSATGLTNAVDTDTFLARYQFGSINGQQYNSTGLYRYYVDGLAIPYFDADTINTVNPPTLHVGIQNIDTTAKSADAAGAIAATFWLEPQQYVQG